MHISFKVMWVIAALMIPAALPKKSSTDGQIPIGLLRDGAAKTVSGS